MNSSFRFPGLLFVLVALSLIAPAAASASHIEGGSITSKITSNGRLQGTVTFLTANACMNVVGDNAMEMPSLSAKNPSNVTRAIPITGNYTRCLANGSTATGSFDVDINTLWGSAGDGAYTITATGSARVGGILNGGSSVATFNTRVTKTGFAPSAAPVFNSGVATTVPKNYPYKQNLNPVDPDGASVAVTSRAGQGGPTTDFVTITSAGVVSMTAAETNTYNDGDAFSYQVRATDASGDYSERDTLLTVSGNNAPPSINGLPNAPIAATAGAGAQTVNFTADDPNNANPKIDTVQLTLADGTPAWVTLNAPAGNPANATLTVNPPSNVPAGTYTFNVDGVDSDTSAPLFASEAVQVTVVNAVPATTINAKPSTSSNSASPTFTFSSDDNAATFECQLDGGSWTPCTSPKSLPGVGDGSHTFKVRAIDGAGQVSAVESYTWTIDATAPAKPGIDSAPSALAQASSFAFTVPAGEFAECQIDGGAWATCTSPFAPAGLADGAHTFSVRSLDAAGNRSDAVTAGWTLDTTTPSAPAVIGATEGNVTAKTAQFTWTGEDGGSFECKVDSGAFTQCASPFSLANVTNGKHTFAVRQIDAAGNVGATRSVEWTVGDAPAPTPAGGPTKVEPITGANASVAVQGDTASVGCRVNGGALASCFVDVYAYDRGDETGVNVSGTKVQAKASGSGKKKLVLVGKGRVKANGGGARRLAVDIELNEVGRRLVAEQITGIRVVLKIEARTVQGPKLKTRTGAKLIPQKQLIVPENGLFKSGSSTIAKAGAKLIKSLGDRLGKVKAVTCVGHTDSVGSAAANEKLGLARATAVCAALKKNGARGKVVVKSAGETRPRATNSTVKGRALNRRVEISVRYR